MAVKRINEKYAGQLNQITPTQDYVCSEDLLNYTIKVCNYVLKNGSIEHKPSKHLIDNLLGIAEEIKSNKEIKDILPYYRSELM